MTDFRLVRGTQLLRGYLVQQRTEILQALRKIAWREDFREVILPSLEFASLYDNKLGEENSQMMYRFPDKKGRELCLRPEGTATLQAMARTEWKNERDIKLWYEARCWRYERPQAGRYREFTQFGVEWLNPKYDVKDFMVCLAASMAETTLLNCFELNQQVKRGLSYYIEDGFEITVPVLGAQRQVCGGGRYAGGFGFAFGVERLVLAKEKHNEAT